MAIKIVDRIAGKVAESTKKAIVKPVISKPPNKKKVNDNPPASTTPTNMSKSATSTTGIPTEYYKDGQWYSGIPPKDAQYVVPPPSSPPSQQSPTPQISSRETATHSSGAKMSIAGEAALKLAGDSAKIGFIGGGWRLDQPIPVRSRLINEQSINNKVNYVMSNLNKSRSGFIQSADILSQGAISAEKLNQLQRELNKQVYHFNLVYGSRELTPAQYNDALKLADKLEKAQNKLDAEKEKVQGGLVKAVKLIKNKDIQAGLGAASMLTSSVVGTVQIPKRLLNAARNKVNLTDIPKNVYKGIVETGKHEIEMIRVSPTFGIARVVTLAGVMIVTARLTGKGITLTKRVTSKTAKSLNNFIKKVPNKNKIKLNIEGTVKKVGSRITVSKVRIDGLGPKGVKGVAGGVTLSIGKGNSITYSFGKMAVPGKLFRDAKKVRYVAQTFSKGVKRDFITRKIVKIGKTKTKVTQTRKGVQSIGVGGVANLEKLSLALAKKRQTGLFNPKSYLEGVGNIAQSVKVKNIYHIIGKNVMSKDRRIRYAAMIRDISAKSKTGRPITFFRESRKSLGEYYKKAKLTPAQRVVATQEYIQSVNSVNAVIGSAIQSVSKNLVKRIPTKTLKKIPKTKMNNVIVKLSSNLIDKTLAGVTSVVSVSQINAQMNKVAPLLISQQKLLSVPKTKSAQVPAIAQVAAQRMGSSLRNVPRPITTPITTALITPSIPISSIPIGFFPRGSKKVKNLIVKDRKYLGFNVVGKSKRKVNSLTRLPIKLESSLNIGAYFAMRYPKGYAILTPSTKGVKKEQISRPIKIPSNYFLRNRNKLNVIKRKKSILIKRRK